jgi:hypothetical protein
LIASRSETAIAGDLRASLELEEPRARRRGAQAPGQDPLF